MNSVHALIIALLVILNKVARSFRFFIFGLTFEITFDNNESGAVKVQVVI